MSTGRGILPSYLGPYWCNYCDHGVCCCCHCDSGALLLQSCHHEARKVLAVIIARLSSKLRACYVIHWPSTTHPETLGVLMQAQCQPSAQSTSDCRFWSHRELEARGGEGKLATNLMNHQGTPFHNALWELADEDDEDDE